MLWNRWDELRRCAAEPPRRRSGCASTRWSTSPGSTSDRARDWVVRADDGQRAVAAPGPARHAAQRPTADYLTQCIAIAKAVQD